MELIDDGIDNETMSIISASDCTRSSSCCVEIDQVEGCENIGVSAYSHILGEHFLDLRYGPCRSRSNGDDTLI